VTDSSPQLGELPRYLLTDREAFAPGEARLAAPPPIRMAEWSSDGRYVLAVRQEKAPLLPIEGMPSGELGLVLWNRQTGRSQEIWRRRGGPQRVEQLAWMPGTHVALMIVESVNPAQQKSVSHRTLFWIDPARRLTRPIRELAGEKLEVSPREPFAALLEWSHERARLIRADGSIGQPLRLWGAVEIFQWSPDGRVFYWSRLRRVDHAGMPLLEWLATNLRTRVTTVLSLRYGEPRSYQEKPLPVQLRSDARAVLEAGPSEQLALLWLESSVPSEQTRCLICANSSGGSLAPDASAVLYLAQGAAWVVPLTRLPRAQMLARIRTLQRGLSLFRARKIAYSLSLYLQDYDGEYPPVGDTAIDAIRPYLDQDDAVFPPGADESDFVYRYTGGPPKSLRSPATTELGYLPGPGGRAVIYADRHVEWRASTLGGRTDAPAGTSPPDHHQTPSRSRLSATQTLPPAHVPYRPFHYPGGSP
jgi:hypothetical protein